MLSLLAGLLLLFIVNNHAPVSVSLFPLPYAAQMPLFVLPLLCFCAGLLAGGMALSFKALRLRRLLRHARTRNHALDNELALLRREQERTLPVQAGG